MAPCTPEILITASDMAKGSKLGRISLPTKVKECLILKKGNWLFDKANGFGTLVDKHGVKMTGAWRDNKLNGYAVKVKKNGDVYEGFWIDDKKNGEGCQKWINGGKYTGHFVNGKLSGEGTFEWPDGSYYKGKKRAFFIIFLKNMKN